MNWINVKDDMPPEKDSIFAKYYGTDKWTPAMFKKASEDVLVTIEFDDGKRITSVSHTNDGIWSWNFVFSSLKAKVLFWALMPEPCKDDISIRKRTNTRCTNYQTMIDIKSGKGLKPLDNKADDYQTMIDIKSGKGLKPLDYKRE